MYAVIVGLHALAGVACFVAGYLVLRPPEKLSRTFQAYLGSLAALVFFLAWAMNSHVQSLSVMERLVYGGLLGLSLFMGWRALQARSELMDQFDGWRERYMDHIGFTLISLFEGFVIVGLIDLGADVLTVVAVAVIGLFLGIGQLKQIKRQELGVNGRLPHGSRHT